MNSYRILSLVSIVLLCSTFAQGINNRNIDPPYIDVSETSYESVSWIRQPQIYNMGAFSVEDVEKYHITVNGLWNGFIGDNLSSPFAFARLLATAFEGTTYTSDKEFVDAQHDKGVYVPATILTIQGHRSLQEDRFDEFASRSINGELCQWDEQADSYWMNAINPDFVEWCINHGKKAIDAGADMIVLDEIQGNGLIPMYQFAVQYTGIPAPGFSDETMNGFKEYLINTFTSQQLHDLFGISDLNNYDLKERIASTMNLMFYERIQSDSLISEYNWYLEYSNFQAKKQLILALREYADEQGKDIVITANSYALGTNQAFGFWSKGLLFADLLDMFTFENTYTAIFDTTIPQFYQTKWLAWERLAFAATDNPAVILIDTKTLMAINENLFPLFGVSNSLGVLCAEAFANKGSFVNYHFPFFTREKNWGQVENIHDFVMDHQELYDYNADPYGNVGIVFLYGEGMRQHMDTYLGCAQALAESHIPFDVVFDGDEFYIDATLSLEDITSYPLIVVPSLVEVTDEQIQVIQSYVQQGGIAIVFNGDSIGYPGQYGEISYGEGLFYVFEDDVGKNYFETYNSQYKKSLSDVIRRYVDDTIRISMDDRKIIATPYIQTDKSQLVLHVVNYDHIGFFDFLWPHHDITISLKDPGFSVNSVNAWYMDGSYQQIEYTENNGYIECILPTIKDYVVIQIQ